MTDPTKAQLELALRAIRELKFAVYTVKDVAPYILGLVGLHKTDEAEAVEQAGNNLVGALWNLEVSIRRAADSK